MIWPFLKKRWFSAALVLIILAAIVRKNLRINVGDTAAPPVKKEQVEKYTRDIAAAPVASQLGIVAEGPPAAVKMPAVEDAAAVAFLKRFGQVAVAEQKKFGMPASVLLASAYVNSFAGRRDCATQANNFLAVRCTAEWGGPVKTFSGACFRQYNTAWESIRDFNVHLSKRPWYEALKKSAKQDWRAWAKGLAKHPEVSDIDNFEQELSQVIRAYRLFELDQ